MPYMAPKRVYLCNGGLWYLYLLLQNPWPWLSCQLFSCHICRSDICRELRRTLYNIYRAMPDVGAEIPIKWLRWARINYAKHFSIWMNYLRYEQVLQQVLDKKVSISHIDMASIERNMNVWLSDMSILIVCRSGKYPEMPESTLTRSSEPFSNSITALGKLLSLVRNKSVFLYERLILYYIILYS